jgi:probable HAF family extracellular repeat protein
MTVLPFFCIERAKAATFDPYFSDPNTAFFGRLIILNDELNAVGGLERRIQQTQLLEAALQPFDLRGSRPTPTNRVSLQPSLPTASGSGTNLSRDGSCAVGYQDSGFFTFIHAFRWTQATGPVDLGTLDPPNNASRSSFATDTNQDCSVVVGDSDVTAGGVQHAFRWTSGGMVDLGVPTGGGPISRALGVSSNGTVIVGDADFPGAGGFPRRGAFRWTTGGFQDLGSLQQNTLALATALSGDGAVVVGWSGTTTSSRAFRWTTQTQTMEPIGPLPGHATAAATGVSDNGKIVVGISHQDFLQYRGATLRWNNGTAFRWTQATGIQDLRQILINDGADMTGIALVSVTGMSPDGQWIQGKATTPQTGPNETVAFIAQVCDDDIGGPCKAPGGGTAPFTLGASPSQLTVSAGNSGTTTITVTPDAGFNQPVTFSCGNLPVGAACSFNPATVTPAGGPVNTTLTITTNGGPVALLPGASTTMVASLLASIFLIPIGVLIGRRGSDRRLLSAASGCVIALAVAGMLSCSSSDSTTPPATGTPAGTSNVTVTGTSGSNSRGVPVTLTVTR